MMTTNTTTTTTMKVYEIFVERNRVMFTLTLLRPLLRCVLEDLLRVLKTVSVENKYCSLVFQEVGLDVGILRASS